MLNGGKPQKVVFKPELIERSSITQAKS